MYIYTAADIGKLTPITKKRFLESLESDAEQCHNMLAISIRGEITHDGVSVHHR